MNQFFFFSRVYTYNAQLQFRSNPIHIVSLSSIPMKGRVASIPTFPKEPENVFKMGITTRSGKSTKPNDPTLCADDWDLWAFQNHPERWQETFYTNFVDSDEEEGEIVGDEESAIADGDGKSKSATAAMGIDAKMKDGDPNVENDDMDELSRDYIKRDGSALFKSNEVVKRREEDPIEDDDEADGAFAWDKYDPNLDSPETVYRKSFAASAEDIETEGESLCSDFTNSDTDIGEKEGEGTDSLQPDFEDDKAQTGNLGPSIEKGKTQAKYTCTCTQCGEKGHNRL